MERGSAAKVGCVDESSSEKSLWACLVMGRRIGHWMWVILYFIYLDNNEYERALFASEFDIYLHMLTS